MIGMGRICLRRGLAALVLTGLVAACSGTDPDGSGYRDTSVPLTITTRGGAVEMRGNWVVRAHYPGEESLIAVRFIEGHQGISNVELVQRTCEENGDCEDAGEAWKAKALGQNRWRIASPHGNATRELWVIWVDEGFRTAAIGAPDGRYGWILDRAASGGEDRIFAAQQILDFNGYDTGALVMR